MPNKKEINANQAAAIDELFANGFNRTKAYLVAFPNCKPKYARASMQQLLAKPYIQDYYDVKYKEYQKILGVGKRQMVDSLKTQIEQYEDMLDLAMKPQLTASETEQLERMKEVIKGSDIMKAKDMICKIIGAYEPEKIEVTDKTYKVSFDLDSDDAEIIA